MTDATTDELFLEQIACGPMQNFAYAIGSRGTREVALVDPAWNVEGIVDHVREQGFEPIAALVTHYHPDHAGNAAWLCERFDAPLWMTRGEFLTVHAARNSTAGLAQPEGHANTV